MEMHNACIDWHCFNITCIVIRYLNTYLFKYEILYMCSVTFYYYCIVFALAKASSLIKKGPVRFALQCNLD